MKFSTGFENLEFCEKVKGGGDPLSDSLRFTAVYTYSSANRYYRNNTIYSASARYKTQYIVVFSIRATERARSTEKHGENSQEARNRTHSGNG